MLFFFNLANFLDLTGHLEIFCWYTQGENIEFPVWSFYPMLVLYHGGVNPIIFVDSSPPFLPPSMPIHSVTRTKITHSLLSHSTHL